MIFDTLGTEANLSMDGISLIRKGSLRAITLACMFACTPTLASSAPAASRLPVAEQPWPTNGPAQRDFPTAQFYLDKTSRPARIWLISAPLGGVARAVEFFSGEQVDTVSVTTDGKRVTFFDSHGYRYSEVKTFAYTVNLDQPSTYAAWQSGDAGHDVVFGAALGVGYVSNGERALLDASPGKEKKYFSGQASCEPQPYVVETRGTRYQDTEKDFIERAKILADFDRTRACWTSKPLQVVDLEDNTFLLSTQDRVFRINSKDVTPSGLAPDLKIVDVPTGDLSTSFYACVEASNGVTAALNDCIGTEHDAQDKRLNVAYRRLRDSLAPELRTSLRDEERGWIVARDRDCAADGGGTGSLLDANQCVLNQTARRASVLEARLAR
ncbi:MAG: lysozyme inhibitor LprI family protein [Luteibacter sp.]|uniref:lysozyme inhibitor LprI family protein n=1 Tax=unclassified Luteibacter TaxID=2620188 RepID=UPI0009A79680|nr:MULTISPECIES: lysozyme inhibitor LprI family protein [unclassified Luteibacter]MDQ7998020.1 lysozyme inhibitor LprI family protein [Luteibacter sp.]SKB27794.1 Uncharacterized conserved protein YecT, DUF1311 family [Luteibacter sp. 22Crub2.1]